MVDHLVNSEANKQRISFVENCFGAFGQPLLVPGRVLVGEGELVKLCRKSFKPRQFYLFNDILVYGNIVLRKKQYVKQRIIPLEDVTLEDIEEGSGPRDHGWQIRTPTKSFAVFAATHDEKREWMDHLTMCIRDLLRRTGKVPSTEKAAVWVPDTVAAKCMRCLKTVFTLINRRHHCRKCGLVVCGTCSSYKFLIPALSSKPKRVCQTCFQTLSRERCIGEHLPPSVPTPEMEVQQNAEKNSSSSEESDDEETKTVTPVVPMEKPKFYNELVAALQNNAPSTEETVLTSSQDRLSPDGQDPSAPTLSTESATPLKSRIGNLI